MNGASLFSNDFFEANVLASKERDHSCYPERNQGKTQDSNLQYELKVDVSHLSRHTLKALFMLFLEAKWFYNYILANGKHFRN
jgi:hypothetical protein